MAATEMMQRATDFLQQTVGGYENGKLVVTNLKRSGTNLANVHSDVFHLLVHT